MDLKDPNDRQEAVVYVAVLTAVIVLLYAFFTDEYIVNSQKECIKWHKIEGRTQQSCGEYKMTYTCEIDHGGIIAMCDTAGECNRICEIQRK